MKKVILAACSAVFVLAACQKEVVEKQNEKFDYLKISKISDYSSEDIGELHNLYLNEVINEYLANPSDGYKNAFLNVTIPYVSIETQEAIFDHIASMSIDEMKDSTFKYLSSNAINLYNSIDSILENTSDSQSLSSELALVKSQIENTLDGSELAVLEVYLETVMSSAYFWYPTNQGGSGLGDDYRLAHSSNNRNVPDWVKADGRGAGYGMVAWSFSALLGPVAPVGFIYGTVTGAVTNSFLP